jgi:hypothetical protein
MCRFAARPKRLLDFLATLTQNIEKNSKAKFVVLPGLPGSLSRALSVESNGKKALLNPLSQIETSTPEGATHGGHRSNYNK